MKICIALATVATLLGGCATFSPDGGFTAVSTAAKERGLTQDTKWIRTEQDGRQVREVVRGLLGQPLTADSAVQIALINNGALQASYAELGIAESDLVQAGRLPNPVFAFERLRSGEALSIDRTFVFNVLALITMPARTAAEKRRFALLQDRAAAETLRVAADTRRAWHSAVAAQEATRYMERVNDAADAGAELARRMAAAGNFSKLDQAREEVFHGEITARLARTRQAAVRERERLTRLVGLSGEQARYALPERLPELPQALRETADLEERALAQRLDVRAAIKEAENIAASMGLMRTTGFINLLELGYRRNSETGKPHESGYEATLALPVFDWGDARLSRAQFAYMQAVSRAAEIAVRARSEVRESYDTYRTAFELARHYRDEIVPLRKRISEENLLRYNGMLVSVFELLADMRQQVAAVSGYLDAQRDFWLAETTLQIVLTGGSPGTVIAGDLQPIVGSGDAAPGH